MKPIESATPWDYNVVKINISIQKEGYESTHAGVGIATS